MDDRLLLLYLDREHVGDTMFVKELSARLNRLGAKAPHRLVVHESGPQTEQALEGRGLFVDREGGVFAVSSVEEQDLVERSIRQTNRRIVALLSDHQVASVSIQGSAKGLFRWTEDDRVKVGATEWIRDLIEKQVVPVISPLAIDEASDMVRELPAVLTVSALARTFHDLSPLVIYFTTDKGLGIRRDEVWKDTLEVAELRPEDPVADLETVAGLVGRDLSVLLTSGRGLKEDRGLRGTRVVSDQ